MTVRAAYDAWSATYDSDANATRDLDARAARRVLGPLRPKSVLELGCGTGKNTVLLARLARKVHCLDFSPGMIARARERVRAAHVSFALADLTRRWPCEDGSADLIVCDLVLEHIKDLPFIFSQARRALEPGGRFFVCELHPARQYQGKQARFSGGKVRAFVHHVSDFTTAAASRGLALERLDEWWHAKDAGKPPRLISFVFAKRRAR